ncbi:hypothetical protein Bbelb_332010 [Branchiostoma belcheri]|nr:hypothetical protein Bbelb_332010 [Branchiostoma belcheri]
MFDDSFFSRPLTISPTKSQPQTTFLKTKVCPTQGVVPPSVWDLENLQAEVHKCLVLKLAAALPPFVSWYSPHYPNNISRPASLSSVDSRRLTWLEACRLRAIDAPLLRSE